MLLWFSIQLYPSVSFIIPQELVSLISSHALLATHQHSPTLLDLQPPFTLHRLLDIRDIRIQQHAQKLGLCAGPMLPQYSPSHFFTRANISNAMQSAINSAIDPFIDVLRTPLPAPCERVLTTPLDTNVALSLSMATSLSPQPCQPVDSPSSLNPEFSSTQSQNIISYVPSQASPLVLGNLFLSSCPGKKGAFH